VPDPHLDLLARLAQPAESKIVLLVLDGIGDLVTAEQPRTALQQASTPHLDTLAARSAVGRVVPVTPGVTPGSGPGHLALFGYDPARPDNDIGRGVLEALGIDLDVRRGDVCARGNFASVDDKGRLTDRRAGRISTAENRRLCARIQAELPEFEGLDVTVASGEGHRFVLLLRGPNLFPHLEDTDPQETGVPAKAVRALDEKAAATADAVRRVTDAIRATIHDEERANEILLRGFSSLPHLPQMPDLYKMRCGAFAGYPLYRGVASACGMQVIPCGKHLPEVLPEVSSRWLDFDFFFLHIKQPDMAGEDGDLEAKVRVLEAVDEGLPALLDLSPDVLAVTGDHSTPAPLRGHSWHPVPLLLHSDRCFVDPVQSFDEDAVCAGHLGTVASRHLLGLLLANAGRLAKFGA
jgi:2,3-bisphosphoglycerate-independent phosphoglycerate mutase